MHIFQLLLLAFILVPVVEIYVLIQVGGVIGALPTVLAVIATALLGVTLIRAQGLTTLTRAQVNLDRGELPAVELLEGVCLVVAGVCLLTPGFVTDTLGFALLIPPLRRWAILAALERGVIRTSGGPVPGARRAGGGRVIEGEYRQEEPGQVGDEAHPRSPRRPDGGT